jgi:hypothetical protein
MVNIARRQKGDSGVQFQSDDRIQAEEAATKLYEVLERIGVVLDDIHIDEPCIRCSTVTDIKVGLGGLHVDDVEKFTEIIEGLSRRAAGPSGPA